MVDVQEDSPINSALRQFEATEANLAKLEHTWSEIEKLTPEGPAFGNDPAYEEHVRVYEDVLAALPKIDGWKPESVPMDLNSIGQNRLDAKEIGEITQLQEIQLPLLEEQRRIVARIDELAAQINEARALRQETVEHAEALQASRICKLFTEGSVTGWTNGRLGDYVVDDCYGTSEKTCDDDTGIPILAMGNIQNGRIDTRRLKYLHLSEKDRRRLLLRCGDILVNRIMTARA